MKYSKSYMIPKYPNIRAIHLIVPVPLVKINTGYGTSRKAIIETSALIHIYISLY